jgi:hypothetical protein
VRRPSCTLHPAPCTLATSELTRVCEFAEEVRTMTEGRVGSATTSSELNIRVQKQEAELLSIQVSSYLTRACVLRMIQ